MNKQKTLLFVGAHPDDETFSVGGTLAYYASAGVQIYYACATRGEAGSIVSDSKHRYATVGELRWAELKCAAQILGLVDIIHLGYRDSGMSGSEENLHPEALVRAPLELVAGSVVKVIRKVKPQVVITFDPIGGYRHPDHIATHNAVVKAFYAAGDPEQYVEAGPTFHPQKLYFHVFRRRLFKVIVKLMPLFGQNPHHFGINKDIDIASLVNVEFPVHAAVRLTKQAGKARNMAIACHSSQTGGRRRRGLLSLVDMFGRQSDLYMRAYPPVQDHRRESDLFEGI